MSTTISALGMEGHPHPPSAEEKGEPLWDDGKRHAGPRGWEAPTALIHINDRAALASGPSRAQQS